MPVRKIIDRLRGSASTAVDNRRAEERVPTHERAVVSWRDHLGLAKADSITIVNVSSRGVAFSCSDQIEIGRMVTVTTANRTLDAVVRHARATGRGFYVGVEVLSAASQNTTSESIRAMAKRIGEADDE